VKGTMNVGVLPADISEDELKKLHGVLAQTIANSLPGVNAEDIKVNIDPTTGIATHVISTNDPAVHEAIHKKLKTEDFHKNISNDLTENSQHLPKRLTENLKIHNFEVTFFLSKLY